MVELGGANASPSGAGAATKSPMDPSAPKRGIHIPRPRKGRWADPRVRWSVFGVATLLVVGAIGGAMVWELASGPDGPYLEVHMADAPADVDKVLVRMHAVYVGEEANALGLDATTFDILDYQAPHTSVQVASGHVPVGSYNKIGLVFAGAKAFAYGTWVDLRIESNVLEVDTDVDLAETGRGALLIDMDMDKSICFDAQGMCFKPRVKAVYFKDLDAPGGKKKDPVFGTVTDFEDLPPISFRETVDHKDDVKDDDDWSCVPNCGGGGGPTTTTQPTSTTPAPSTTGPLGDWEGLGGSNFCGEDDQTNANCEVDRQLGAIWDTVNTVIVTFCTEAGGALCAAASDLQGENGPLGGDPMVDVPEEQAPENLDDVLGQLGQDGLEEPPNLLESDPLEVVEEGTAPVTSEPLIQSVLDGTGDDLIPTATGAAGNAVDTGCALSLAGYDDAVALLDGYGANVIAVLCNSPTVLVQMDPTQAATLLAEEAVLLVESNLNAWVQAASMGPSPVTARGPSAFLPETPYTGAGVGVAVVDSGIDGTHPDLTFGPGALGGAVPENWKLASVPCTAASTSPVNYELDSCQFLGGWSAPAATNTAMTDTNGHGTEVAGVACGRESAAVAGQTGVAPGCSLYGFSLYDANVQFDRTTRALGVEASLSVDLWHIARAYDVLISQIDAGDPIRVVTNSWGIDVDYAAHSIVTMQVQRVLNRGVTVVFAAGNSGGDGSTAATNPLCRIPDAALLCVAGSDDQGTTSLQDSVPYQHSSRGRFDQPTTWPDIAAPATDLHTTMPVGMGAYAQGFYGTSAAAPFLAGVVAMMYEANPTLTNDQVAQILAQTAHQIDSGAPYRTSSDWRYDGANHVVGHGVVDIAAALALAETS